MLTDRTPLDELLQRYCDAHPAKDNTIALLYKFEFPVAECIAAYEYLRKVNYNAAKLFPGYDGVVRDMDEFLLFCQVKKLIQSKVEE